jgi:hypothetical protein
MIWYAPAAMIELPLPGFPRCFVALMIVKLNKTPKRKERWMPDIRRVVH